MQWLWRMTRWPIAAVLVAWVLAAYIVGSGPSAQPTCALPALPCPVSAAGPLSTDASGSAWLTIANGDNVRFVTQIDGVIWAGTQAGGVVRWDAPGRYRQYLYPQDGLAANDVRAIIRYGGKLWFATSRGLSSLGDDGRWASYTVASTGGGLPSDDVTSLAAGPDGSLWVGTRQVWDGANWVGGGLARYQDGGWTEYTPNDGIPSFNVVGLAVDQSGRVWAVGQPHRVWVPAADTTPGHWEFTNGGASVLIDGSWTRYERNDRVATSLPNTNMFYAVAPDRFGNVWFGTGAGLLMFGPRGWAQWTVTGGGSAGNPVTSVGVGDDGRVWMGVIDPSGYGLSLTILDTHGTPYDHNGDTWRDIPAASLPAETVQAILPLAGGTEAWLGLQEHGGNGGGLARVSDSGVASEQRLTTGLSSNYVSALAVAPDGAVWIGSGAVDALGRGHGLDIRGPDGSWSHYRANQPSTTPATTTSRAASLDDAVLYVALSDPTAVAAAFPGQVFTLPGDDTRYTINSQYSLGNEGLLLIQPPLARNYPAGSSLFPLQQTVASDNIAGIAFDKYGIAWIAARGDNLTVDRTRFADGGLSRVVASAPTPQWQMYQSNGSSGNGLPTNNVSAVAVGSDGRIWVGTGSLRDSTGSGLAVLDPTRSSWTTYTIQDGLASNNITSIVTTPEGDVWVAGASYWSDGKRLGGGVSMLRGGTWTTWSSSSSALVADSDEVHSLGRDRKGAIWAGGWHYEGPNLRSAWPQVSAAANRFAAGEWTSWTFPRDGWIIALAAGPDGRLWAATSRGETETDASEGGLWVWDGRTWLRVGIPAGLADKNIQSLTVAADGSVWIGTVDHGLSRYNPAVAPLPTAAPPTATPSPTPTLTPTPQPTVPPDTQTQRVYLPYISRSSSGKGP
ncbi:MAG: two-component regulator propeller domain-containing protein [Anaerolineae bacterium]